MDQNIFCPDQKPEGYFTHGRNEMLKYIPPASRRILDIGCGTGNFGKLLKTQMDVEVWGVEICHEAAREAAEKIDKIIIGDIEKDNLNLPDDYFDCIVFNDVLEHLQYPWNVLINCKVLLQNGGYVVASIPNVRYLGNIYSLLVHKNWEYTDDLILDKTHLRFFTERSIREIFKQCGYSVMKIEGICETKFSKKLKVLNFLLKNSLDDMKYLQFACVAQMNKIVHGEHIDGGRKDRGER